MGEALNPVHVTEHFGQRIAELEAENRRLREALGSCVGLLVSLRDDEEYDFAVDHYRQIRHLCLIAFNALHGRGPMGEHDAMCTCGHVYDEHCDGQDCLADLCPCIYFEDQEGADG